MSSLSLLAGIVISYMSLESFNSFTVRVRYTLACPPLRGNNPRTLTSGLSYEQVKKHGITIFTTYISIDLAHNEIFRVKVGKGGMKDALNRTH